MKLLDIHAAIGTAIILLSSPCDAKHSHELSHLKVLGKRHNHRSVHASPRVEGIEDGSQKRGTQCQFPTGVGLVAVTPGSQNAGWAMSPDQPCLPGNYCPYACPPGQVMDQWDPSATSYTYPQSMNGGLYCDSNGDISKPFPNNPYCVPGTNTVGAQNTLSEVIAFCQTVLPGNEAMLIPTSVTSWSQLAVPSINYWCETAAHYYINGPGVTVEEGCIWGDGSQPIGNWAPYVAGANTDGSGNTFVKIAWNPIWTGCSLSGTPPTFGVKIVCSGNGCNGVPCSIDPSVDGIGGVTSADQASGAGGANFCVVTVPPGETANIVVFEAGNSGAGSGHAVSSSSATPTPSPTPTPTPSSTKSTTPSTTTTAAPTTSVSPKSSPTISLLPSSNSSTTSAYPTADNSPHILFENQTTLATGTGFSTQTTATGKINTNSTTTGLAPISSKKSAASETLDSGSILSLIIMFAVAGYLL